MREDTGMESKLTANLLLPILDRNTRQCPCPVGVDRYPLGLGHQLQWNGKERGKITLTPEKQICPNEQVDVMKTSMSSKLL